MAALYRMQPIKLMQSFVRVAQGWSMSWNRPTDLPPPLSPFPPQHSLPYPFAGSSTCLAAVGPAVLMTLALVSPGSVLHQVLDQLDWALCCVGHRSQTGQGGCCMQHGSLSRHRALCSPRTAGMGATCSVDPELARVGIVCSTHPRSCTRGWSTGVWVSSDSGAALGTDDRAPQVRSLISLV